MTNVSVLLLFDRLRCKGYPVDAPIYGGAQRITFQLAQRLALRGYRVFLGSDDSADSGAVRQLIANNITHVYVPFRSPGWLSAPVAIARLLRVIRREGIKVVHCHDRWTAMFGRCASLAMGVDYFYTAHLQSVNRRVTASFFGPNITAVSEAVKRNLITYFGMDGDTIQVIYNGKDMQPASAQQCQAIEEKYGLRPSDRVISSIGRLSVQKGHRFLLQALARLTDKYPELKCFLIGDGNQRIRLEEMARDLDLCRRVVFCGGVEHVAPFIQLSEFTVLPSLSEGFGLAALESLLLGVPVVASRIGGVPEVVVAGVNGLLVEPKDVEGLAEAIRWMLENREQARRMGSNGLESARVKFSSEAMLSAYENYYATRLSSHADRGLLASSSS
jgi:glycosyltransferase involved in cell wall biosynthesis